MYFHNASPCYKLSSGHSTYTHKLFLILRSCKSYLTAWLTALKFADLYNHSSFESSHQGRHFSILITSVGSKTTKLCGLNCRLNVRLTKKTLETPYYSIQSSTAILLCDAVSSIRDADLSDYFGILERMTGYYRCLYAPEQ